MEQRAIVPRELLPHEAELVRQGVLRNVMHSNSSAWIFERPPTVDDQKCVCFRHMGDIELSFLLRTGQLPDTQPYQTLVRGEEGLAYCKKYFQGKKRVDTNVVTIVEFVCPVALVDGLFATFHKAEDGCLSTGLGSKAGKTLSLFNAALQDGRVTFSPVFVKRKKR